MLRRSLLRAALGAPAVIWPSSRGFAQDVVHDHEAWTKLRRLDTCLVKLKPEHDRFGDYMPVLKRHGAVIIRYFPTDRLLAVRTPGKDCEILAADLEASNAAEKVTPNLLEKPQAIPNDPFYTGSGGQPNFLNIGCEEAWEIQKLNGRRDIPPVIDINTGATHSDLTANLITGWNTFLGNTNTTDNDTVAPGHGTACASLVCAVSDNSIGMASLGWGGTLMPICASDNSGNLDTLSILSALQWILDNVTTTYGPGGAKGAINLSFTAGTITPGLFQALWNAGFFICGSTGDVGSSTCINSPCLSPFIMPVASVTNSFVRDSYSDYGPSNPSSSGGPGALVAAIVGSGIRIARPTNTYSNTYTGTSFAAPQVAALAQYLWAANPRLTNSDVSQIIANPANGIATTGFGGATVPCISMILSLRAALGWTGSRRGGRGLIG